LAVGLSHVAMASAVENHLGDDAGDWPFDATCTVKELRARLAAKQEEAERLRGRLQHSKLQVQQLRMCLTALGVDSSVVPHLMESGGSCGSAAAPEHAQRRELRALVQWIAECVDLTQQVVFECGSREGKVAVGGRRVLLQRMVAWRMALSEGGPVVAATTTSGDPARALKLSVPMVLQAEIVSIILRARHKGGIGEEALQQFAEAWEMVGAEVVSAAAGRPEPAIFLVHRVTGQAMVVARWPAVEFSCRQSTPNRSSSSRLAFDPDAHFSRLACAAAPPSQTAAAEAAVAAVAAAAAGSAEGQAARSAVVAAGDRVEVEYEGRWFEGVLCWATHDAAHVQCDADAPGVITVAPLSNVRATTKPKIEQTQSREGSRSKGEAPAEAAALASVVPSDDRSRIVQRRTPNLARARSFG